MAKLGDQNSKFCHRHRANADASGVIARQSHGTSRQFAAAISIEADSSAVPAVVAPRSRMLFPFALSAQEFFGWCGKCPGA
jgi:hypothetical protein